MAQLDGNGLVVSMDVNRETILQSLNVLPQTLEPRTFILSPIDLFPNYAVMTLVWPVFFNYDINGERFVHSLRLFLEKYPFLCGRLKPHADMRFVVEVTSNSNGDCGVPFTEYKSEMSVAKAILEHTSSEFPMDGTLCYPELSFFQDKLDAEAMFRGEEPLMKVKLAHFSDGCVLCVALPHMLMDAQRYFEVLRDLGRAYRGITIPDRDFDRSYLWPDQLAKKCPSLGEEVAKLPRKILPSREMAELSTISAETVKTYMFYFTYEMLAKMKAIVKPWLADGDYVSSNDVIVAFLWMLNCELLAEKHPVTNGGDLGVQDTSAYFTYELLNNGHDFVPKNYTGNAFGAMMAGTQGMDLAAASLEEVLARLAVTIRTVVNLVKTQPQNVA